MARRGFPSGLAALALLAPAAQGANPERGRFESRTEAQRGLPGQTRAARAELRERLGPGGLLSADRRTGAVRALARLDGFLTGSSAADGAAIALGYVREHAAAFGLDAGDLEQLDVVRRQRSPSGMEHIVWGQSHRGIPAIDSSLRANLTADGRLLSITGAPRPDLALRSIVPGIEAERAHRTAVAGIGSSSRPRHEDGGPTRATSFANGDRAELVIHAGRLAWRVLASVSSTEFYDVLVDAQSGELLRRENRVKFASAQVFDYFPGAAAGGEQTAHDITGYLPANPARLLGANAHAFVDRDDVVPGPGFDTFAPPPSQETGPSNGNNFNYGQQVFALGASARCPARGCTWNPFVANSWLSNANQAATQLFWFVNRFHDHLLEPPIGFDAASGNFEGADRIVAQALDGANTDGGLPDAEHANNANMLPLPDGFPGLMQMYLFDPSQEGIARGVNGGDDGSIAYHEYTHGLNNRLVTDAQGFGALDGAQGGAIDEAHADWYAMDFLEEEALRPDTAAVDVRIGVYPLTTSAGVRTQALDCRTDSALSACPASGTTDGQGYTYGDFGRISGGGPEVHADGEIWAQTLWQLRQAVGGSAARALITDAMRLVPSSPSFLDMRNAILLADTNAGGGNRAAIWQVFAARGMGYFASTADAADTRPVQDFSTPPTAGGPSGTLTGTVRDADTLAGIGAARIAFGGHDTGLGEDLAGASGGDGSYSIPGIPAGTYPLLIVEAPGYERLLLRNVTVGAGENILDLPLRRNWAAAAGGASIASFSGSDATEFGCGPGGLIDGSGVQVWGTESPRHGGPKEIVVQLPQAITLAEVRIDPSAGCGDDPSAALRSFEVQASSDGSTYSSVSSGAFGPGDTGRTNPVSLQSTPSDVRFVKLRAIDNQSTEGSGLDFMDVAELEVFGSASAPATPADLPAQQPGSLAALSPATVPLRFLTRRARARRNGSFVWRLQGPPGLRGSVSFTASLPRRARSAASVRLGVRRFAIPASGRLRLLVRPSRRARRRLAGRRSVRVTARLVAAPLRRSSRFTLVLPRTRRR